MKVDTGMSRIGLLPNEAGIKTAAAIMRLEGLEIEGAFSHFAKADERGKTGGGKAVSAFHRFLRKRGKIKRTEDCN